MNNPAVESFGPADLFNPTQRTYAELLETIRKCKLQLAEPMILKQAVRFSCCPQLAHIERNVFKIEPSKFESSDNVRIVSAPNERAEVRFVAGQIRQLVESSGYSRYAIWKATGIDQGAMSHFLAGRRGLSLDSLDRLAEFLDIEAVARRSRKGR